MIQLAEQLSGEVPQWTAGMLLLQCAQDPARILGFLLRDINARLANEGHRGEFALWFGANQTLIDSKGLIVFARKLQG
jgi:hypothetical protein